MTININLIKEFLQLTKVNCITHGDVKMDYEVKWKESKIIFHCPECGALIKIKITQD